ncbi:NAD-glutamate dehydrogenase domain-containing protein [Geodermatophilus sp. URMC 62]|uniref:NAD-glutamate dehydrogenase domain-containing protein n=1 Tax=Geodermatophilus sp. URMC 62 TaxID=3423414 RepID=UPI00406C1AD0
MSGSVPCWRCRRGPGRRWTTVRGLDADRILRALLSAVSAVLRTNASQRGAAGEPPEHLSSELAPAQVAGVPEPRPGYEIRVHNPGWRRAPALRRGGPRPREIVTTILVNRVIASAGITFAFRAAEETGADATEVVRAQAVSTECSTWRCGGRRPRRWTDARRRTYRPGCGTSTSDHSIEPCGGSSRPPGGDRRPPRGRAVRPGRPRAERAGSRPAARPGPRPRPGRGRPVHRGARRRADSCCGPRNAVGACP